MGAFVVEKFYLFFQGVLVFQTIFLGIVYLITFKKDILIYSTYLLAQTIYFFWNAPYTFFGIDDNAVFDSAFYFYANTPLIIITNLLYTYFLTYFFTGLYNNKKRDFLVKLLAGIALFLVTISVISIYVKQSNQYIFYLANLLSTGFSIYIFTGIYKKRIPNTGWIVTGMILNIIGNALTVLMIILERYDIHHLFTDDYPLFFMRCGILADIFFYLIAILKKWNYQEKQLAVQQIESQLAIEKVRNNISSQLHDDIGSTLSGVSMYSHLANDLMEKGEYGNAKKSLHIIQNSTNEMVEKLSDLVWSANPKQDSLQLLFERLQQYGYDMCNSKNMVFTSAITIGDFYLSAENRYQLYLFIKEAINNAVKYSDAGLLQLNVKESNRLLEITISDDGKGFDIDTTKRGNGLDNMQKRADELGGDFNIQSKPGAGCLISLKVKITQ
ncbi:MAG: ATP-binding protein [Ferruginibacter sp.]